MKDREVETKNKIGGYGKNIRLRFDSKIWLLNLFFKMRVLMFD